MLVGAIAGAHGVRGEVKIKPFTGEAETIARLGPLSDESGARIFRIVAHRVAKGALIARLDGIDDRDRAEGLKGTRLYVARAALPPLEAESWYYSDLIGLSVEDDGGAVLGKVTAVQNYGAGDLLEIAFAGREGSDFVAFAKAFVPLIDVAGGRIVVTLPEDFFDTGEAP